eukprot:gene11752-5090_t
MSEHEDQIALEETEKLEEVEDLSTMEEIQLEKMEILEISNVEVEETPKKKISWKLIFHQVLIFICLFISYCAIYCFHPLISVSTPLLIQSGTLTLQHISLIVLVSKIARVFPQMFMGGLVDIFGGKLIYVCSHALIAITLILCGIPTKNNQYLWIFFLTVLGGIGSTVPWPGLLKMATNWFDYRSMGKIMAGISISFLLGDSLARIYFGAWIRYGVSWNVLFIIAGATMLILNLTTSLFLADSPKSYDLQEPAGDPRNILGDDGLEAGIAQDEMFDTFLPILKSPSIWILVIVYIGQTFMRYVLNDWIVSFFVIRTKVTNDVAASVSAIPPLIGAVSVVVMGFLNDKLSTNLRNLTLFFCSVIVVALNSILFFQTLGSEENNFYISLGVICAFNFFVIGPYSLPAGSMSVEYGGKKINATLSAIFEALSMIGASCSGLVGTLFFDEQKPNEGWDKIFGVLFATSILISICTFLFCIIDCIKNFLKNKSSK